MSQVPSGVYPSVRLKTAEVITHFPAVTRVYGFAAYPSDHRNHKCVDFMTYADTALGNRVAAYLRDNARRLGVAGIIFNRRVAGFPIAGSSPYRGPSGLWRPYTGTNDPHTNHVHVEFHSTAYVQPPGANMASAQDIADAVFEADVIENVFTGNPDNKSVTLETALVYLMREVKALRAEVRALKK